MKLVLAHFFTWIIVILCLMFTGMGQTGLTYEMIVIFLYFGLLNILVFYTNYLWILPKVLARKKYIQFIFSIITLILVAGLVKYALARHFKEYVLMNEKTKVLLSFREYFIHTVLVSIFFIFFSSAIKFTIEWFTNDKINKNLEKEKLSAELAFLKSQINPHFLLNSLNNIYSLAYQRSEKTPEAVLKLSEIMRYMLYESNDKQVEIGKEVRYLENYIELQKIRYKDSAFVALNVSCDNDGQTIEPLILIPFIENAFKHGVINDKNTPLKIDIDIHQSKLKFKVFNKKNVHNKDVTGGIGFHNIQRRLELLYPGKHMLTIVDQPTTYTCELSLDLS